LPTGSTRSQAQTALSGELGRLRQVQRRDLQRRAAVPDLGLSQHRQLAHGHLVSSKH
jgi:hypothetical protein